MIVVHVQHFLTPEGQQYFDDWLRAVAAALQDVDGFQSLRRLRPVDASDECHLLLTFASLDQLRAWAASETHDALLDRLEPFRLKTQRSRIFRAGEPVQTATPDR
ncbi:MAG: hypothetical protein GVY18_18955 [Bacteroidetes bacterium]|jgi:antibiotic biosynthesis monooxygenase (ABM) superfamily enzyme|nr:hypothetical protein [Bacteroidota bacterium]